MVSGIIQNAQPAEAIKRDIIANTVTDIGAYRFLVQMWKP
jgi:hypothetical protein